MTEKIKSFFSNWAIMFYVILAMLVFLTLYKHDRDIGFEKVDWEGIWVEAHGMFFDILILGLLLAIYDHFRERKDKIERYTEEIDDYRYWKEPEATYRILGLIRRLNREGITAINLSYCFLNEAIITNDMRLNGSTLSDSSLKEAEFHVRELKEIKFERIDFQGKRLVNQFNGSSFSGSIFDNAKFHESDLTQCKFYGCKMKNIVIEYTNLESAEFNNANLENATFRSCKFNNTDFFNASLLNISLDGMKIDLSSAKFYKTQIYSHQVEVFKSLGADISQMIILEEKGI